MYLEIVKTNLQFFKNLLNTIYFRIIAYLSTWLKKVSLPKTLTK